MKKLYVIEMIKAGKQSYVEFSYDIIWHDDYWKADFYNTPEEAEADIPDLLKREEDLENNLIKLSEQGLYQLPENYQKPEIRMRIREIEINLI